MAVSTDHHFSEVYVRSDGKILVMEDKVKPIPVYDTGTHAYKQPWWKRTKLSRMKCGKKIYFRKE